MDTAWNLSPSILIGVIVLAAGYFIVMGPLRRRLNLGPEIPRWRQATFYAGLLIVLLALISPIDEMGDSALFSAHMSQHMLLTYFAPPLWLLGTPSWLVERILTRRWQRAAANLLVNPVSAFILFNAVMWGWHIPAAYDTALENENIHIVQHLMFMASATIGWWPIVGPAIPGWRSSLGLGYSPAVRAAYIFISMFSCTALSALIAFANHPLYPFYGNAAVQYGLTALSDQQLGAMLMWLPADLILLASFLIVIGVWLNRTEAAANQRAI